MKQTDTTAASAHSNTLTLFSSVSAERESQMAGKFRSHLLGIYTSKVGPEWGSDGRREGDYLHHIDIAIKGRRQVVAADRLYDLEPGQVWLLPGNTPVERRCKEQCEILFLKFSAEWLPGVDPLLDWPEREPRLAGTLNPKAYQNWLKPGRILSVQELLEWRGQLLMWIAQALPELDAIISNHLKTHAQFTEVFKVIEENLGADLRLAQLARAYGTTVDAFSMAFTRNTGISPKDYLKRRLNQEALQLVIDTDLKCKEIAEKLRFNDEFYFSRFFSQLNGRAPSAYRQSFRMATRRKKLS